MGTNAFIGATVTNLFPDNRTMPVAGDVCAPLRGKYEAVDDAEIADYFSYYPELVPILVEAYDRINTLFGVSASVCLNMPDDDDETDTIKARVYVSGMDVLEAYARFGSAFGEWWYSDPRFYKSRATFAIGAR